VFGALQLSKNRFKKNGHEEYSEQPRAPPAQRRLARRAE